MRVLMTKADVDYWEKNIKKSFEEDEDEDEDFDEDTDD